MRALVLGGAALLLACDHEPDPTLARMLEQRRVDPFEAPMRVPPGDTVTRDDDRDEEPPPLDRALLENGRQHYFVACAPCHGVTGDANTYVAARMTLRKPPSLVGAEMRRESRADMFRTVTDGYGLMPPLANQLSTRERWAVVAYVQALQLRGRP